MHAFLNLKRLKRKKSYQNDLMKASWLFICLFLSLFSIVSLSASSEINLTRSKLIQLALHLEVAEPELKYDFCRYALIEMYNAYQTELNKSYKNLPKDKKKRAKVRRWGYATRSYLEHLEQYFLELDSGKALDFFVTRQNIITLLIGEQALIITGPNTSANKKIEQNVVEQFCRQYDCREYFSNPEIASKQSAREISEGDELLYETDMSFSNISGSWTIYNDLRADFVTTSGIDFNFDSIENRVVKQKWALDVVNELRLLVNSLEEAKLKGHIIHWSTLTIADLPVTDKAYKITINRNGNFLKLSLPLLGVSQEFFKQFMPWIQSHFDNTQISRILIKRSNQFIKF